MPIPIKADAQERALRALAYMIERGYGITRAVREARSSRRTLKKFMQYSGIKTVLRNRKLVIVKSMQQKVNQFLLYMSQGHSATRASKMANTTVRTMRNQERLGVPIIIKVGGRWEPNVLIVYRHNLVIYGHVIGLGGNIQGFFEEEDGTIISPDAPSIWWQIDFDDFISTLPDTEVGEFWAPIIVNWLRNELEVPFIANEVLVNSFLNNDDIIEDAINQGRLELGDEMPLTYLENLLSRYNVRLHNTVNYGLDDNHPLGEIIYIKREDLEDVTATGLFQVFYVKDAPIAYPQDGPLELIFDYDLNNERV